MAMGWDGQLERDRVHLARDRKSVFMYRFPNLVRRALKLCSDGDKSPEVSNKPSDIDKSQVRGSNRAIALTMFSEQNKGNWLVT